MTTFMTTLTAICWYIIGAFVYTAWTMIIGDGITATLIFFAIWTTPVVLTANWFESEPERTRQRAADRLAKSKVTCSK